MMNATQTTGKLSIWGPSTPGAMPSVIDFAETLAEARAIAARFAARRKDLRRQDVEIRLGRDGKRIEFAG